MFWDGKICEDICRHAPPEKKWPCIDCNMSCHDRAEPVDETVDGVVDETTDKLTEAKMTKLIFDRWAWKCENCGATVALPGIVPNLQMLIESKWKFCPCCGEEINFKEMQAPKPDYMT